MRVSDKSLGVFGEVFFSIELESDPVHKGGLIARMVEELLRHGCIPEDGRGKAELCFDEAVTNALTHGNRKDPGKRLRVWLFADADWWGALLEDEGEGFDPHSLPDPEARASLLRDVGRGILLMDRYVDDLVFGPKGNQVLLARRRRVESEAPVGAVRRLSPVPTHPPPSPSEPQASRSTVETIGPARIWTEGRHVLVEVTARRLDDVNVRGLKEAFEHAAGLAPTLIIDLTAVTYLSSVVIGALIVCLTGAKERKGGVVLCGLQPIVQETLRDVRVDTLFPITPTRGDALETVRQAAGASSGQRPAT